MMHIIVCTGGNPTFTEIILSYGFKYGARLPDTVQSKLFFADQDWKVPKRAEYVYALYHSRPEMATVLDLEEPTQFREVMNWAYEISVYVNNIIIIPKYNGAISKLPREVNGKRIILGYSVPSQYGKTLVPYEEFHGWPIHLLGGCPFRQKYIYAALQKGCDIVSIDGNYMQKQATQRCQFFYPSGFIDTRNRFWPTLKEFHRKKWEGNGPQEAFRRSCEAYKRFWS